jgi:predicted nucleotide-binding protein (sugar kinase/HSP70/actin superfamily)
MFDSRGQCRLRHYWVLQELTLKRLGYKFRIYPVSFANLLGLIKKFNPGLSYLSIFKKLNQGWEKLKKVEGPPPSILKESVNIGIVGEIFTCLEPAINLDIEKKLKELGANILNTVRISDFIKASLRVDYREKRTYKRRAKNYLNGRLGGHGFENLYNAMYLADRGIDGLIHLLPLSCMPETTIEPILDKICADYNIPLLRLPIDETHSEINFNTRLETFVDLIKRRKK